jgi:hypothetical protein
MHETSRCGGGCLLAKADEPSTTCHAGGREGEPSLNFQLITPLKARAAIASEKEAAELRAARL